MTLNGLNALLRKKSFYEAHQKNLNEDRPILWTQTYTFIFLETRIIDLQSSDIDLLNIDIHWF